MNVDAAPVPGGVRHKEVIVFSRFICSLLLIVAPQLVVAPHLLADEGDATGSGADEARLVAPKAFHVNQTPVIPYPSSPGPMQPSSILEDTTDFNYERIEPDNEPFFFDVKIMGSTLMAATARGLMPFNVSNPQNPQSQGYYHGPSFFPQWFHSDKDFFIKSLYPIVKAGNDLLAVGAEEQGLVILSWNGTGLSVRFQDTSVFAGHVYAAALGDNYYAFVADKSNGLYMYNITGCDDSSCTPTKVQISSTGTFWLHGTGDYLVSRPGVTNIEIRNMSNPLSPSLRVSGTAPGVAAQVGLWEDPSGNMFLGIQGNSDLWIYDVTCAKDAQGCSLPSPNTYDTPDQSIPNITRQTFLSVSQDGDSTYLYVGNLNRGTNCTDQREYLFDASNYSQANSNSLVEITPSSDYWGWYYEPCRAIIDGTPDVNPPGFNNTTPMRGAVYNNYFFRAAFSFLDSHCLGNCDAPPPPPDPVASFTWDPTEPTTADIVSFQSTSTGTGLDTWNWDFDNDGNFDVTNDASPDWQFSTAGVHPVRLQVADVVNQTDSITQNVTVAEPPDPSPQVDGVTADTSMVDQCGTVTFEAVNPSGESISFAWNVTRDILFADAFESGDTTAWDQTISPFDVPHSKGGLLKGTGTNPHVWTANVVAGDWIATVEVSNVHGTAEASSPPVRVNALPELMVLSDPAEETPTSQRVQFHASFQGATEWNWDWGDGSSTGWTSDPDLGEDPTHDYAPGGPYSASVQIRNCMTGPVQSASTGDFTVPDTTPPPIADFSWDPSSPNTLDTVNFTDLSTDNPHTWSWDFDNDGMEDSALQNPTWDPPAAGDYPITLIATNDSGASNPVTQTVTVVDPPPVDITIDTFGVSCQFSNQDTCFIGLGSPITLDLQTSGDTPDLYQYDWDSPDGTFTGADEESATPITSKTYSESGCFFVVVRVLKSGIVGDEAIGDKSVEVVGCR